MQDSNTTQTESSIGTEPQRRRGESDTEAHQAADLTQFQINILRVLAEESRYGLAVKEALEAYYGEEINHGRMYPNLDTLVENGLVEKSELDKRTNFYELTDEGRDVLVARVAYLADALDGHVGSEHRLANAEPARTDGGAE